jgi:hypothetical protein
MARRSVLRSVAGIGVVGAAAAVGAGAAIKIDKSDTTMKPVSKPVEMAPMAPSALAGPLVVYISDITTGQFDAFAGSGQTRVRNPELVKQILANIKLA